MSLKAFHVIFISLSILLCWGFGAWCIAAQDARGYLALGWGSILLGFGLIGYEIKFLRKLKSVSML